MGSQGKLIKMLKESVTKLTSEKTLLKIKEEELSKNLEDNDIKFRQLRSEFESKLNTKSQKVLKGTKTKKNSGKRKAHTKHNVKIEKKLPSPKKLKLDINKDLFKQPLFEFNLDLYRLPVFEILKAPIISHLPPVQKHSESINWPLVPYYAKPLLVELLDIN